MGESSPLKRVIAHKVETQKTADVPLKTVDVPQETEQESLDGQTSNREALSERASAPTRPAENDKKSIKDAKAAIKTGDSAVKEIKDEAREGDITRFAGISSSESQSVSLVRTPKSFDFGIAGEPKKDSKAKKKRKRHKKNVDGGGEVGWGKSTHSNTPPGKKGHRLRDSEGRDSVPKKKKKRGEKKKAHLAGVGVLEGRNAPALIRKILRRLVRNGPS